MYKPQREMKPKKLKLELNKETIEVLDKNSMLNINGAEKETSPRLIYGAVALTANILDLIHDNMDQATNCPFGPCTNPGGGGGTEATVQVDSSCLLCEVVIHG